MKLTFTLFSIFLGIATLASAVDYKSEIEPILKSRCGECHMDGKSKGKVSFDPNNIAKEMGGSIIPGDVKKSNIHFTMTLPPDDEECMPPKGKRVPKNEIDLIAKWIEEGAKIDSAAGATLTSAPGAPKPGDAMMGDTMGDTMGGATMGGAAVGGPKPYKGVFKNNKGMQLNATLTRVDGDRAILKLPDGKDYRYPVAMFAPDTQEIVKQFQAGTLAPAE